MVTTAKTFTLNITSHMTVRDAGPPSTSCKHINSSYKHLLTTDGKYLGQCILFKKIPCDKTRPQEYGNGGNVFLKN